MSDLNLYENDIRYVLHTQLPYTLDIKCFSIHCEITIKLVWTSAKISTRNITIKRPLLINSSKISLTIIL